MAVGASAALAFPPARAAASCAAATALCGVAAGAVFPTSPSSAAPPSLASAPSPAVDPAAVAAASPVAAALSAAPSVPVAPAAWACSLAASAAAPAPSAASAPSVMLEAARWRAVMAWATSAASWLGSCTSHVTSTCSSQTRSRLFQSELPICLHSITNAANHSMRALLAGNGQNVHTRSDHPTVWNHAAPDSVVVCMRQMSPPWGGVPAAWAAPAGACKPPNRSISVAASMVLSQPCTLSCLVTIRGLTEDDT